MALLRKTKLTIEPLQTSVDVDRGFILSLSRISLEFLSLSLRFHSSVVMRNPHSSAVEPLKASLPLRDTSGNANYRGNCERGIILQKEDAPEHETNVHGEIVSGEGPASPGDFIAQEDFNALNTDLPWDGHYGSHMHWIPSKAKEEKNTVKLARIPGALSLQDRSRYRQYRQRSRKELGKDGKPVWSNEMEDAFQIGMTCD